MLLLRLRLGDGSSGAEGEVKRCGDTAAGELLPDKDMKWVPPEASEDCDMASARADCRDSAPLVGLLLPGDGVVEQEEGRAAVGTTVAERAIAARTSPAALACNVAGRGSDGRTTTLWLR